MLQLISNHPEARDLASHNPNLLWLFANIADRKKIGPPVIRYLLRQRPEVFLSYLIDEDVGKAAVKFLRKVVVTDGNLQLLELLLNLLTHRDKIALFAHHWKRIPQKAIPLVVDNASQVLSRCLARELKNSWIYECEARISKVGRLWEDVQLLGNDLGNYQSTRPEINRLQSISQMQQLHDRWTDKIIDQEMKEFLQSEQASKPLPTSPLPANRNIIQIRNLRELFQESKIMRHCVFSRYEFVFQGGTYYYRMYWPERCTVEVQQVEDEWSVTELKLQSNDESSRESWKYIWNWLNKAVTKVTDKQGTCAMASDVK